METEGASRIASISRDKDIFRFLIADLPMVAVPVSAGSAVKNADLMRRDVRGKTTHGSEVSSRCGAPAKIPITLRTLACVDAGGWGRARRLVR